MIFALMFFAWVYGACLWAYIYPNFMENEDMGFIYILWPILAIPAILLMPIYLPGFIAEQQRNKK